MSRVGRPPKVSGPRPLMTLRSMTYPATEQVMGVPDCPRCGTGHMTLVAIPLRGRNPHVSSEGKSGILRYYAICPRTQQPIFSLLAEKR